MAVATSATSSSLALSGLASGIDWTSIVKELLVAESAPETRMQANETADQNKGSAYQAVGSELTKLNTDVTTLSDPTFFDTRTTSLSNGSVASATAASGTALGAYNFTVSQLASDAVQQGSKASGKPLSPTNDVSGLVLSSAGFANPLTAGTFAVNGQTVTLATSDTLQSVFDKISAATSGAVTGSYNASTDEISLSSSAPIVLGSATDTSNFLQAAELYNNGGNTITSVSGLGGVNLSNPMDNANLSTTISDGGSGAGEFAINGVAINFNASTNSVNDVLQKINDSTAGVTATYDSLNGRFELTNKTPGDVGISLQDVTGNFLAGTGLSGGTLQRGNNLLYSINGGGTLTSQSNTINGNSSGVTGLSITALGVGSTTVSVSSDTSTIAAAISSFVTDYNSAQNYISGQIATSTDSTGNVTLGTLTGDMDAEGIMTGLRHAIGTSPSGLSGGINGLNDLGIATNGTNNTLALNSATLTSALTNNLSAVKDLFTNSTNGVATTLGSYIGDVNGSKGALANDETNMNNEVTTIKTSITTLQQKISNDQTSLDNEFSNMETIINSLNTEKQYLNDYFASSSATSNTAPTAAGSSSTG
ncbi:MAG TPA: flagellar filament capping protein FliD [Candidatus Saccharimonadales bacterium]|nr:flagellar filament capping protein FliD [Candidatus Saccharimonadales bacterium]